MAAETRRTRHVPTSLPILGRSEERLEERPQAQNSHLPRVESKYPLPIARRDVPHHLIYPLKETRPNLHIFIGIYVKHVVFYEYVLPVFFSHRVSILTQRQARYRRCVHIRPAIPPRWPNRNAYRPRDKARSAMCRVFPTPGILERSGIGAVLEEVGVKQCVNLSGVGENYQGPFLLRDSRGPTM